MVALTTTVLKEEPADKSVAGRVPRRRVRKAPKFNPWQ